MKRMTQNTILAFIGAAVPLAAHYSTASAESVPGTGFSILLYKPFDFAYLLLVTVMFVFINIRCSIKSNESVIGGGLLGITVSILWFGLTFLVLGEMHLKMGGKL